MTEVAYLAAEHPIRFAHRGSRELWPENTWYGFDAAVGRLGYRYIETDVQVTKDGVVVVFHDDTLDRTTNGVGKVADWYWADIANLDAGYTFTPDGSSFPLRGTGIRVSNLVDTFERYPDVRFNLDLKARGCEWAVAEAISRTGRHDTVLVGSFNDRRLSRFRRITKGLVATAAGPRASILMYAASRAGRPFSTPHAAFQLPVKVRGVGVDRRLVDAIHASGSQLHVWTVNDPGEMRSLLDSGVDGIVSDRPDLLNDVMEEFHADPR